MKTIFREGVWQIELSSGWVVPILHRLRLEKGIVPLACFDIPDWKLMVEGKQANQCATDLRVLCLARTAWTANQLEERESVYMDEDNRLQQLVREGRDLLGSEWPIPSLLEIPIEDMIEQATNGKDLFNVDSK